MAPTVGHHALNTVFQSVQFANPALAETMREDINIMALYGATTIDKTPAQEAATRLRRAALDLPEVLKRVLNNALDDLLEED